MRRDTILRKNASQTFKKLRGTDWVVERRIKGYTDIHTVVAAIEAEQAGNPQRVRPAA